MYLFIFLYARECLCFLCMCACFGGRREMRIQQIGEVLKDRGKGSLKNKMN